MCYKYKRIKHLQFKFKFECMIKYCGKRDNENSTHASL